jgi:RhoGAP domain
MSTLPALVLVTYFLLFCQMNEAGGLVCRELSIFFFIADKSTIENFKPSEIVGTEHLSGIYKRYDNDHQSDESLDTETGGVFKVIKKERKRDKLKGFIPKIKDEESGKVIGMQLDSEKEVGILFGVDLEKVEKHGKYTNIPKFVVDCITILSECDKICTQGLYRASGNKTVIEKLKKQLNSPKQLRKHAPDSQFKRMQENDVHTLTGLLKLYFRELKSPLIPTKILDACTKGKQSIG